MNVTFIAVPPLLSPSFPTRPPLPIPPSCPQYPLPPPCERASLARQEQKHIQNATLSLTTVTTHHVKQVEDYDHILQAGITTDPHSCGFDRVFFLSNFFFNPTKNPEHGAHVCPPRPLPQDWTGGGGQGTWPALGAMPIFLFKKLLFLQNGTIGMRVVSLVS